MKVYVIWDERNGYGITVLRICSTKELAEEYKKNELKNYTWDASKYLKIIEVELDTDTTEGLSWYE